MPKTNVSIDPLIDRYLTKWEHHGRPGVPQRGFTVSRLPGKSRRGIYRADSEFPVYEGNEHILLMSPSPTGQHIAVQLAPHADENGILALLDVSSGELHTFPSIHCRYDPMRWSADGHIVELVARDPHALVSLDVTDLTFTTEDVATDARVRLFPGGERGILAESRPGHDTTLMNRATGSVLAQRKAIHDIQEVQEGIIVHSSEGLEFLERHTGKLRWSWVDPTLRITASASTPDTTYVLGVRAGTSRFITVIDGEAVEDSAIHFHGDVAVASALSIDNDDVFLLIEGPTTPPRVVTATELRLSPTVASDSENTTYMDIVADDGTPLTAIVTSPQGAAHPAPMILTCYGGFGVADLPVFEPTIPAWIQLGGRYVTAHVRGGGERGAQWHAAGSGVHKHRGIEDLTCIARGLISAGLTRPDMLILVGASHGGVLVTSCAFENPQLCAGIISTAAPLNLLSLQDHPLGSLWMKEFGDPDSANGIAELRRISPLHRAQRFRQMHPRSPLVTPPRFLGIILDEDSRVSGDATHAVAEELERHGGDASIWIAPNTGHGGNHLDSLHQLGATILSFAAAASNPTRPSTERSPHS